VRLNLRIFKPITQQALKPCEPISQVRDRYCCRTPVGQHRAWSCHRELRVGLAPLASIFVTVVVLVFPLIATVLLWTSEKRLGLILLSLSMFGSLLFGLYHHFLAVSPDHVHSQPASAWGTTFVVTAYLLLITEAIGTYVGVHFLWVRRSEHSTNTDV